MRRRAGFEARVQVLRAEEKLAIKFSLGDAVLRKAATKLDAARVTCRAWLAGVSETKRGHDKTKRGQDQAACARAHVIVRPNHVAGGIPCAFLHRPSESRAL